MNNYTNRRSSVQSRSAGLDTESGPITTDCFTHTFTREQFKRSLKSWLFECAYGRRRVWETVQSEGAPKKWTHLLTYLSFCYQYQCNWLPGKIRPQNDLLCVEWDVKPCSTQLPEFYLATTQILEYMPTHAYPHVSHIDLLTMVRRFS